MPELQVRDLVRIDNVSRTGESIAPYAMLLGTATFPYETEMIRSMR
jgi:hypothetical protein